MKNNLMVIGILGMVFAGYLMTMPGCGSKNNSNVAASPYGVNCQPGQYCPGGYGGNTAAGIPLINSPTFSALDTQGSALILSFAAPGVVTGAAYNGQVNIAGQLHLAPGACSGLYGGDFPVQGQGSWYSGYAGAIAGVQGQMTVSGGTAGGSVYLYPALVKEQIPQLAGYNYAVTTGYGVAVSFCNRTFAFYN